MKLQEKDIILICVSHEYRWNFVRTYEFSWMTSLEWTLEVRKQKVDILEAEI